MPEIVDPVVGLQRLLGAVVLHQPRDPQLLRGGGGGGRCRYVVTT